ncbi:hypothetical protein FGO68_gene15377 [Halteria grandinella]|uniref:AIG1-type G domain-containing protein n=1 Tax=Halteria grandinella TaxID=5974 RepID=A0A8J8NZ21_HALGN|nr:hypothetical protein FGO68_gene15377 [Halteria grandinella]
MKIISLNLQGIQYNFYMDLLQTNSNLIIISIMTSSHHHFIALKEMNKFCQQLPPSKIFCIITDCDSGFPDDQSLQSHLQNITKYSGFQVTFENITYFNKNPSSLRPLYENLQNGGKTGVIAPLGGAGVYNPQKTLFGQSASGFSQHMQTSAISQSMSNFDQTAWKSKSMFASKQQPTGITIIPFGAPGVGKSNVLNKLIGKPYFYSSSSCASGVTKKIKFHTAKAFGQENPITVCDAPGVGDMELSLKQMIIDLQSGIGTDTSFDLALMVLKASDTRTTIQEIMALKSMKNFFDNFSSKKVMCVVTHCDQVPVTDQWIAEKLKMLHKYTGVLLEKGQVIRFNNTSDSLKPLLSGFIPKEDIFIKQNLEQEALRVMRELPNDLVVKAANEGLQLTYQEKQQLQKIQQQHEELKQKIKDSNALLQNLREELARPKTVYVDRNDGGCL